MDSGGDLVRVAAAGPGGEIKGLKHGRKILEVCEHDLQLIHNSGNVVRQGRHVNLIELFHHLISEFGSGFVNLFR